MDRASLTYIGGYLVRLKAHGKTYGTDPLPPLPRRALPWTNPDPPLTANDVFGLPLPQE